MRGAGWEPAHAGQRGRAVSCRTGANRKPTASPTLAPLCTHTFIVATSFGSHIRETPQGQAASRRGKAALGLIPPPRRGAVAAGGQPALPHVLSNRRTGRRSCSTSCHRDTDNAKAKLPSPAGTRDWARGCRTGAGPTTIAPSADGGSLLPHHLRSGTHGCAPRVQHGVCITLGQRVSEKGSFLRRCILQGSQDCLTPGPETAAFACAEMKK